MQHARNPRKVCAEAYPGVRTKKTFGQKNFTLIVMLINCYETKLYKKHHKQCKQI